MISTLKAGLRLIRGGVDPDDPDERDEEEQKKTKAEAERRAKIKKRNYRANPKFNTVNTLFAARSQEFAKGKPKRKPKTAPKPRTTPANQKPRTAPASQKPKKKIRKLPTKKKQNPVPSGNQPVPSGNAPPRPNVGAAGAAGGAVPPPPSGLAPPLFSAGSTPDSKSGGGRGSTITSSLRNIPKSEKEFKECERKLRQMKIALEDSKQDLTTVELIHSSQIDTYKKETTRLTRLLQEKKDETTRLTRLLQQRQNQRNIPKQATFFSFWQQDQQRQIERVNTITAFRDRWIASL